MIYYVVEIQTQAETGAVIPYTYTDRGQAEAKYHALLAVASVSDVPKHGAMLFNDDGFIIKSEVYNHVKPEPEI